MGSDQTPRSREAPPSLAAIAASAGVSVATVSKVVNGRADVGPETRARVQKLLDECDYVSRRSEAAPSNEVPDRTVELVLHTGGPALSHRASGYHLAVLEGAVEAATEMNASISVSIRALHPRAPRRQSAEWVRSLGRQGIAAVIDVVDDVHHGDLSALAKSRIPLVVVDPLSLPRRDVPSVGTTNFSGGVAATQHLLDLGHRRIANLGTNPELIFSQARLHGYRAALEAAGIASRDRYVHHGRNDYQAGVAGGGELLDLSEPPTAIFAATDESAAGVIEAARVRGLRVPDDLSVVGFDDAPIARLLSPPLTTIRQPLREMGRVALRTAMKLVAGDRLDSHHVQLATELVVRNSTAPWHE
jgi:LacI family transcriptional regulator